MYQFVNARHITKIYLQNRDIALLRGHGWRFIYVPMDAAYDFNLSHTYSCVDLSKRALGIHNRFIQTPYELYKHIAP